MTRKTKWIDALENPVAPRLMGCWSWTIIGAVGYSPCVVADLSCEECHAVGACGELVFEVEE